MKTINYPLWVEKYRTKGRTIRKVRNGYGLYACTSVYVKGSKYPKATQEYLGMITEADGFIPKKPNPENPVFIEFGLSHFIITNFKRDLLRTTYSSSIELITLAIIHYLFDDISELFINHTYAAHGCEKELLSRFNNGISDNRITRIKKKIDQLILKAIPDETERNILLKLLFITTIEKTDSCDHVTYHPEVLAIIERNGLKL